MTSSDIRTLTISSISMSVKEQNLFSLSLVLHTLYVFPLCRNHTGCNKHTLKAYFSLSCNLLLTLRAMRVMSRKHLLTIGLPWQRAESQTIQNYIFRCPIRRYSKYESFISLLQTSLMQNKKNLKGAIMNRINT